MNSKLIKIAAGLALTALVPGVALAHTDVSIGLNLGGGYYAPAPVYVAPPPPRVYYSPAPVYYGPAPAYYESGVRIDGYYGGRWRHEHRHHRDWDRDRDWDRGWDRDRWHGDRDDD